jgi:hypothetical protein
MPLRLGCNPRREDSDDQSANRGNDWNQPQAIARNEFDRGPTFSDEAQRYESGDAMKEKAFAPVEDDVEEQCCGRASESQQTSINGELMCAIARRARSYRPGSAGIDHRRKVTPHPDVARIQAQLVRGR